MGLETFLPCTTLLSVFLDMKYSNDNGNSNFWLKYTKVFGLKSIFIFLVVSCSFSSTEYQNTISSLPEDDLKVGAERLELYIPYLENKKVGIVGNQSSLLGQTHLVDTLLSLGIDVVKVYSPEHGFRGKADAGEKVNNSKDPKTGLPIVSLYGSNKKPTNDQLSGIEVLVFDIQDVGVRFYTYISTMHYVMEACSENEIPLIVLDRPNPNGHYVDGPVLQDGFESFVGMHHVPIIHGMTIAEYAKMVNGEHWLKGGVTCELRLIPCENYSHQMNYSLPVRPSPNLRSDLSIQLYPSLCLLEGTDVTVGRGTNGPFERYGHPAFPELPFSFIPKPDEGAKTPKHEGKLCYGVNLADSGIVRVEKFDIRFLQHSNELLNGKLFENKKKIFNLLAGNDELWRQITNGKTEKEIRASWEPELGEFKELRKKYLLYD